MNKFLIKNIYLRAYNKIPWERNATNTKRNKLISNRIIELYTSSNNNIFLYKNKLIEHFNHTNNTYPLNMWH